MPLDPYTHLWMHEQEVQRTMQQKALEREARLAQAKREGYPIGPARVGRIRRGVAGLRQILRPAGTGTA
jgi:hypothetical protein